MERLDYVVKASSGRLSEQVFCAFLGTSPREDFIPYVADFYLQLENVKWTIVLGDRRRFVGHVGQESSATHATPASSCAGISPTSAAPADTARWPRRSCRFAPSATSSATCRPIITERVLNHGARSSCTTPVARKATRSENKSREIVRNNRCGPWTRPVERERRRVKRRACPIELEHW